MTPCIRIEHSGVLIFDGRKPWHLPLSFFCSLHDFRISQVILALRVTMSFMGWAAFGSSVLHFWELGSVVFWKPLWLWVTHIWAVLCVPWMLFSQHILYQIKPCTPESWRTDLWPVHEDHGYSTAAGSGQSRKVRSTLGPAAWWGLRVAHPSVMLLSLQKQPWAWPSPPSADPSSPFPCLTSADGKIKAEER